MINSTFPGDKVPNHSGRQADRQTDRETPSLSQLNVNRQDSGHLRARTRPSLPTVNENRLLRVFYPILDQYSTMDSADTGRTSDSCLAMSFHLRLRQLQNLFEGSTP